MSEVVFGEDNAQMFDYVNREALEKLPTDELERIYADGGPSAMIEVVRQELEARRRG